MSVLWRTDCGWPQWEKLTPGVGFHERAEEEKSDVGEAGGTCELAGSGVYPATAPLRPNCHR